MGAVRQRQPLPFGDIYSMPKKSKKSRKKGKRRGRGRPPKFVKDKQGRTIYGISKTENAAGRIRYYATFSRPRKWLGSYDLRWAQFVYWRWLEHQGLLFAYFRKVGQAQLCDGYLKLAERDYSESPTVGKWLQGRKVKSLPLRLTTIPQESRIGFGMITVERYMMTTQGDELELRRMRERISMAERAWADSKKVDAGG